MLEQNDIIQVEGVNSKGFGTIPKLVMQDTRLSISSKAIYSYFCSFAGAGKQAFPKVARIVKDLGISKNSYYKHFNQLKEYGYIEAEQIHKDGRLSHNVYTLPSEIQCTKICDTVQCTKKQDTVKQDTVFCDTRKSNSSKNKQDNKINSIPPIPHAGNRESDKPSESLAVETAARTEQSVHSSATLAESFETFWSAYPNQKSQNAAEKQWRKLKPSAELAQKILVAVEKQKQSEQWRRERGRFIPKPQNWLKDKCWLDKPVVVFPQSCSYDMDEIQQMLGGGML